MLIINIVYEVKSEMGKEQIEKYNSLVGQTPFSFFNKIDSPIVIFDYYQKYICDWLKKEIEENKLNVDFKVEYLKNECVDAACCFNGKELKLVIFEGTILKIHKIASVLGCVYETVKTKNKAVDQPITDFFVDYGDAFKTSIIVSDFADNNIITDYISMIAIKIIIAHEIGHLVNGHIQYLREHGDENINFLMANTVSKTDKKTLQVMEVDADHYAALYLFSVIQNELISDENLNSILLNQDQIYTLIGSAIQTVFYLIGIKNDYWKTEHPLHFTHPPALTRLSMFLCCLEWRLGKEHKKEYKQILQGVIVAQKNIYAYFGTDFLDGNQFVRDIAGIDKHGIFLMNELEKMFDIFFAFQKKPLIELY